MLSLRSIQLIIDDWGRTKNNSFESLTQKWPIFGFEIPACQPARPQRIPHNHERAHFWEKEVQRVQKEILLRHAGRCTALLKDAFQTKCSPQLNTEAGQIKYLGEATLGGQCHVPYMQQMLSGAALWKMNKIHFFQSHFCFSKNSVEYLIASIFLPYLFLWTISNVFSLVLCFILFDNASISHAW